MKVNLTVTLDDYIVATAKKIKEDGGAAVATTINRWAKLGKELEEKKKSQSK